MNNRATPVLGSTQSSRMAFPPHEPEAAQAPVGAGQRGPLLETQRPKTAETDLMITGRHINPHMFKHLGSKGERSVCQLLQTKLQTAWTHQRSRHQVTDLPLEKAVVLATGDTTPSAHRLRRLGAINQLRGSGHDFLVEEKGRQTKNDVNRDTSSDRPARQWGIGLES